MRPDSNFVMVGERTNVTGSKRFAKLIAKDDYGGGLAVALDQVRGGANLIYSVTDHWFTGVNAGVTRLTGDASKSPISIANTYGTALAFVGYRF